MIDRIQGDRLNLNPLRAPRLIAIQLVNLGCPECSDPFQVHIAVYRSTISAPCNFYKIHSFSLTVVNDNFDIQLTSYLNTKYRRLQCFQMHSYHQPSALDCSNTPRPYHPNPSPFPPTFRLLPPNFELWIVLLSQEMTGLAAFAAICLMLACWTTHILLILTSDPFPVVLLITADPSTIPSSLTLRPGWPCECLVGVDERPRASS